MNDKITVKAATPADGGIAFRSYKGQDKDALSEIIRKTWGYDRFCSPKTAKLMSNVYLDACLASQTFTQVALSDGVPVGIIMADDFSRAKRRLKFKINAFISILRLLLSGEGRRTAKLFKGVSNIDKELLSGCESDYTGELSFFAVDSGYRGLGIGKELFDRALSYMKGAGITSFFLFTDTGCNYGFYESRRMRRRGGKTASFDFEGGSSHMTFFLYDLNI